MRGFLAGAALVGLVWAGYEWVRNPHGHRGGEVATPRQVYASFDCTPLPLGYLDQAKGVATPRQKRPPHPGKVPRLPDSIWNLERRTRRLP